MELRSRYGVEDLLALANSQHGPGAHRHARGATGPSHDHLAMARDARDFLASHGVDVPQRLPARRDLDALRRLRDVIRRIADDPHLARAGLGPLVRSGQFRLDEDGRIGAVSSGWAAVVVDLLVPMLELAGAADRLKRCDNPACRWLFLDHSRNRSRQWCEMGICGNRAKASRFRRRRTAVLRLTTDG